MARNVRVTGDFAGTYVAVYHSGDPDTTADPPEESKVLVSRSLDIGQTWTDPIEIPGEPGVESSFCYRPDIATDGLGFYMTLFDKDRGIFMSTSDDHGETWEDPINISETFSSPSLTQAHSVSLDTDGEGTWIAAWIAQGTVPAVANLVVAISGDDGDSWDLAELHNGTGAGVGLGRPQVKCDRNTTAGLDPKWIITFEDRVPGSGGDLEAGYLLSTDGGDSFTSRTINIDHGFDFREDRKPRVDYETSGTWVAVWGAEDFDLGGMLVLAARSSDGLVWDFPVTIDFEANFNSTAKIDPWISTDDHNNWIALWSEEIGDPATQPRDIYQAISYNDGTTWTGVTSLRPGFVSANMARWLNPVVINNRLGKWLAMWQNQPGEPGDIPSGVQSAVPWYSTTEIDIGTTYVDLRLVGTLLTPPPIYQDVDFDVRFTITNNGNTTATNVVLNVTHNDDPAITIVNVAASGAYTGLEGAGDGEVRGGYTEMGPGTSATIVITYNASQAGFYIFSGLVSSAEDDLNLNNNEDDVFVIVEVPPIIADLQITKTAFPTDNANPNQYLGFTIEVRNLSTTNSAPSVIVNDILPPEVTFTFAATSQGTWHTQLNPGGQVTNVIAEFGEIPKGARATFVIATKPRSGFCGCTNTASTDFDGLDPNQSNNSASVSVNFTGCAGAGPDLSIVKTAPANVSHGTSFTYTLVARNNSSSQAATGVTVTDNLPAQVTFLAETHTKGTVTRSGNLITANIGTLAPAETTTIAISVMANSTGSISNTAAIAGSASDPAPANNSSTVSTTVNPVDPGTAADIAVFKSANPSPATAGQPLVYTVEVGNAGPVQATNVVLTDTLPPEVVFVSSSPPESAYSNGVVTYNLASLNAGTTATFQITVTPQVGVTIFNTASAIADQPDLNAPNNSITISTVVTGDGPPTNAELAIEALAAPNPAEAEQALTLELIGTNNGPEPAYSVEITHVLPPGVTFIAANGPQGPVTPSGGVIVAPVNVLAPNTSVTVTITMIPQVEGQLTLAGDISGNVVDTVPANDHDEVIVTVTESGAQFDIRGSWYKLTKKSKKLVNWTVKGVFGLRNKTMVLKEDVPVDFYLSVDATFDTSDTLVATSIYPKLKPVKPPKPGKPVKQAPVKKRKFNFTVDFDPTTMWVIAVIQPAGEPYNVVPIRIP